MLLAGLALSGNPAAGESRLLPGDCPAKHEFDPEHGCVTHPVPVKVTPPVFPPWAAREETEGRVVFRALIKEDGRVSDPVLIAAVPRMRGLESAARKALRRWRYEPARSEDGPVAVFFFAVVELCQTSHECADRNNHRLYAAARAGDAGASLALGMLYAHGNRLPESDQKAAQYYLHSAMRGNKLAQFYLGISYSTASGVRRDYVEAYKWFTLALPDEGAEKWLRLLEGKLSSEEKELARKAARAWQPVN